MGDKDLKQQAGGDKGMGRASAAMEASTDGMAILDPEDEYVYVNQAHVEVYGYEDEEDFLGNTWRMLYDEEEAERIEKEVFPELEQEGEWRGEATGLRADGTEFPQELSLSRMEDGELVCVVRDITERKKREKELERYEAFVENSSDSITHIDENGNILYRNPSSERAEDEPGEMTGSSAFEHIHPEDREHVAEKFFSLLSDPAKKTDSVEYRSKRADGTYEWVEAVATDQRDTEVGGVVVNTRVIEDRKKREKELELYEALFKNTSDMVMVLDESGTILYQSPSVERVMGYGKDERIGEKSFEYLHPDDRQKAMETFREIIEDPETDSAMVEVRAQRADGSYVWLEVRGADQRDTEVGGFVTTSREITERKKREQELERYEAFVKSTSDVVTHIDESGEVVYNSPSIEDVFGYEQGETIGNDAFEYIHPDDRDRMAGLFEATLSDEDIGDGNTEFRIKDANGDYVWVEDAGGTQGDTGVEGIVLNLRDITERKERERELERYETFLENSLDIFSVLDEEGRHIYNSPSVERILGYDPEEHTGEYSLDYIHPDDKKNTIEWFYSLVDEEKEINETELRYEDADGNYVWFEIIGTDKRDTEIGGVVLNAREITERKRQERELREEQQAMETVLSNVPVVVFTLDEDGVFRRSQGKALRKIGLEPGEAVGESVFEMYGDRPDVIEEIEKALSGERVQTTVETNGRVFETWYEPPEEGEGEESVVVGLAYDVTEREKREQELEKYEAFIENSSDITTHLDADGTILYESPSVENVLGYENERRLGDNAFEYVHPGDRERVVEKFGSLLEDDGKEYQEVEMRYEDANGDYVWLEAVGTDQRDTDFGGVVINSRDVTEKKKRERELERYEAFIEHSSDVVTLVEEDGTIVYTSPSIEYHADYSPDEIVDDNVYEYIHPEDREKVMETYTKLLKNPDAKMVEEEFRYRKADGSYIWVESRGTDQRDTDLGGIVVNANDITERKKREQELERYEAFVENSSDLIVHLDESGKMLYESPGTREIFGHEPEVNLGDNVFQYVHPEDRERVMETFNEGLNEDERKVDSIELRLEDADGDYVWLEAVGTDQRDTEIGGVIVSLRDISDRKERERELERYEAFIQKSSDVVTHMDTDGNVLYQSPAAERILGRDPQDRIGEDALEYIHPDDRDRVTEKFEELIEDPETDLVEAEFRSQREDGEYIWLETVAVDRTDTEIGGVIANSRDVTERKRSKERLERSRELLSHTERIADTGGWEYTLEDGNLRWTEGTYDIHGISQDFELTPENIADLYHPEDSEELGRAIRRCITEAEPYEEVFRITQNGDRDEDDVRWVRTNGVPIVEDGEVVKIRGAVQDITEQKRRERELRRSRELLGHTEKIADTGGWELDAETEELRWTDGTKKIHDLPMEYEPRLEEAVDFYHPEDRDTIRRAVENCLEGEPFDKELKLVTAEDESRWVRSLGEPVREEDEVVELRGAIQDITERKERERELRERKEQIDFFNSLLRHDMLNSMTVIGGNADILIEELPEDDERHELAERISKHSTQIVELTERVRSVLRRLTEEGETEMSPTELTGTVEERIENLKETYPEATCETEMPEEAHAVADPFLNHVIDNLLVNAVEHNDKQEPKIKVAVEESDDTVTVRVADNGPGIPDERKKEVFEQGTTGRSSGSVGFGLYYVEQMVSEYGGDIRVEDNEPEGAVFVMEIPKDGDQNGETKQKGGD